MYTYQNKRTGRVVKTTCRVIGNNWKLVEEQKPKPDKKPRTKKNTGGEADGGKN